MRVLDSNVNFLGLNVKFAALLLDLKRDPRLTNALVIAPLDMTDSRYRFVLKALKKGQKSAE